MKTIKIILGIWGIGLFFSCNKFLDSTAPLDRISEDVVWSNKANAETFINQTYNILNDFTIGNTAGSDVYTTNTLGFDGIYSEGAGVFTETLDHSSDMGFNNWAEIRRCNLIITKVAESSGISDDDKKKLIAEGKFLRALSYFNVARKIGRIVWIDKILEPDDDLLLPSVKTPSEAYNYIIQDLKAAIADLPITSASGRANKYAAEALLSEVGLEAIAYSNYPATPSIDASLLDLVINSANDVIQNGGYSLDPDYGSMFNDVNPESSESILAYYKDKINMTCDGTPMQLMIPNMNNDRVIQNGGSPLFNVSNVFEAWVQHGPSYNLAQDYLVIDQNNPSLAKPWNETSQFLAAVDESSSISTAEIPHAGGESTVLHGVIRNGSNQSIWTLTNVGRDARWNASVISDSTMLYGETLTTCIHGNADRWIKINGIGYYLSLTNLYWRKGVYNDVNPRIYVGVPTDYHYVITRLGRIYLNLAEAYLLKGEIAKAVTALNMTRTVHGKLPPSTADNLSKAWEDYKRERRVDLVLENDYYWSLLRWGRYGGAANYGNPSGRTIPELTQKPLVMDISKDRKAFAVTEGSFFSSNDLRVFDPSRRYLFPIPQNYLDLNPAFGPQNKGW